MAQIIFSRNPTGKIGLGLFLLGIAAFVYSIVDPTFGPLAGGCVLGGALVAVLLARRRPQHPHVDWRRADGPGHTSRPIEPR